MTVQELIDALQQYPMDYDVFIFVDKDHGDELGSIEVNHVSGTVDLIAE